MRSRRSLGGVAVRIRLVIVRHRDGRRRRFWLAVAAASPAPPRAHEVEERARLLLLRRP